MKRILLAMALLMGIGAVAVQAGGPSPAAERNWPNPVSW